MQRRIPRWIGLLVLTGLLAGLMAGVGRADSMSHTTNYGLLTSKLTVNYNVSSCSGLTSYKITSAVVNYTRGAGGTEKVLQRGGLIGQSGMDCVTTAAKSRTKSLGTTAVSTFPFTATTTTGWTTYYGNLGGMYASQGAWNKSKVSHGPVGYTYICNKVTLPGTDAVECGNI